MITKEDWEVALKQHENILVNELINIEARKFMVEHCKEKIKEFPEDAMPEDVKDIIKEVAG